MIPYFTKQTPGSFWEAPDALVSRLPLFVPSALVLPLPPHLLTAFSVPPSLWISFSLLNVPCLKDLGWFLFFWLDSYDTLPLSRFGIASETIWLLNYFFFPIPDLCPIFYWKHFPFLAQFFTSILNFSSFGSSFLLSQSVFYLKINWYCLRYKLRKMVLWVTK